MNFDLSVSGMSCGHCAAAVKSAIAERDAKAQVTVDLAAGRVQVRNADCPGETIAAAIQDEGYRVKAIENIA